MVPPTKSRALERLVEPRVGGLHSISEPPATVADAVARVSCSRCGQRIVKDYRIVYNPEGGAAFYAMRDAEQRRDD